MKRRSMPWGELHRAQTTAPDGIVLIDKDHGVTSHDVVGGIRKLAGTRKVGHAGTLDPMATGLLTLGIGRATKLLTYLTGAHKTYECTIALGVATDSDDAEGAVLQAGRTIPDGPTELAALTRQVDSHMAELTGELMQVPASVSAIRIAGKRAHELVRDGQAVSIPARPVTVFRFTRTSELRVESVDFSSVTYPVIVFNAIVECSAGTYVRALARDLGKALDAGAHLRMLRRTRVGELDVSQAHTVTSLNDPTTTGEAFPVLPMVEACRKFMPIVTITEAEAGLLRHGQFLPYRESRWDTDGGADRLPGAEAWPAVAVTNQAIAVVTPISRRGEKLLKPEVLLSL